MEEGEEYDDSIFTNSNEEESLEVNPEVCWDFNLIEVKQEEDRWYRGLERHAYETKCKSYTTKEIYGMWDGSLPFLVQQVKNTRDIVNKAEKDAMVSEEEWGQVFLYKN